MSAGILILSTLVILATASSADQIVLHPPGARNLGSAPSSEFLIQLVNDSPRQGLEFELSYDPNVARVASIKGLGRIHAPLGLYCSDSPRGRLRVVIYDKAVTRAPIDAGADPIVSVTFATEGALPGTMLGVTLDGALAFSEAVFPVTITSVAASDSLGAEIAGSPGAEIAGGLGRDRADEMQAMPVRFALYTDSPGPLSSSTPIRFDLPRPSSVSIAVYDITGRRVRVLAGGGMEAGRHSVRWDGKASDGSRPRAGVFFVRMVAERFTGSLKVLLLP